MEEIKKRDFSIEQLENFLNKEQDLKLKQEKEIASLQKTLEQFKHDNQSLLIQNDKLSQ